MAEIDEAEALSPAAELRDRLFLASLGVAAAFALLSTLLSRHFSKPLRKLAEKAGLLRDGNLDVEVTSRRVDEIGDLSRTLDAMRLAIKKLIGELKEKNATLESRVAERTADLSLAYERLDVILTSASEGIISHDADGTITLFNPEAERIFGYRAEEIVGRSVEELVPEEARREHAENVRRFSAEGATSRQMGSRLEVFGRRKDGSLVPTEVGISKTKAHGKLIMSAFVRDITSRKAAETQLRMQSTALESAAHGVCITDTEGTIQWVNPAFCAMAGCRVDDAVGKNPRVLKSGEHDDAFFADMWQTIRAGDSWSGEIINKRRDGSLFTAETTIAPVLDATGSPTAFVAVQQDISERKRLKQELAAAFRVIKAQKERMEGELNVARDIQMSMLPLIFPAYPDRREFEVHAQLSPAREVGGDFYDFFFVDDKRFCFCVGDVSDKGVPAALFMAVTKTLVKARAVDELSTASIATRLNDELSRENESSMFVTLFLAILDLATGKMTYTNAGHNPPYIRRATGDLLRLAETHGPMIGAMEGIVFGEGAASLSPGELIFAYTDGVTEAMDRDRKMFGEDRLVRVLAQDSGSSAELLLERVATAVNAFANGAGQSDDITTFALRVVERAEDSSTRRLLKLRVKNEISQIGRAAEELSHFLGAIDIEENFQAKLGVALDELLNNIISYAYDDDREHEIHVVVEVLTRRLVLTISDDGVPFNALTVPEPDTEAPIEDREVGGLGILLVRKLMDEVEYHRGIRRNILTLVKHI